MKTSFNTLLGCALALTLAGCSGSAPVQLPSNEAIVQKKQEAEGRVNVAEGYYLSQVQVRLQNDEQLADFVADMKAKKGLDLSLMDKIPNRPIYLMEINSLTPVDAVVKTVKSDSRVVSASRNRRMTADSIRANDPLLPTQWALQNNGQEAPQALAGKAGADMGMDGVTAEGSYDVVVGVIDTGIDYTHEDLAYTEMVDGKKVILPGSNIWVNPGETAGNGINDDNNGDPKYGVSYVDDVYGYNFASRNGDPRDDMGHGTHVAGTIGALRNNFKGIVGINQKVSLMGLKFLSAEGSGSDFDAQMAVYYAIDMKKRFPEKKFILTNSWGSSGRASVNGDDDDDLLTAFAEAVNANILVLAAAGNEGVSNRFSPSYPANYANKLPAFITVGATNNLDRLATFSSYGFDQVQIAAPGVLTMSTVPENLFGRGYEAWSGTSMATPHVTGAAALLWAENPSMTADQVKDRILNTVDIIPALHGAVTTSGRLNIRRALANDENKRILPVAEEVSYVHESPRGDDASTYDLMTKIEQKGAKEISVCFSRINLSDDFDWIEIMGADYRVKDTITKSYKDYILKKNDKGQLVKESRDLCSAPVLGETLYIRLSKQGSAQGLQGFQTKSLKVVQNADAK